MRPGRIEVKYDREGVGGDGNAKAKKGLRRDRGCEKKNLREKRDDERDRTEKKR